MNAYGPDVVLKQPAMIHPTALLHGKVTVQKDVSIWPYVVVRSEMKEVVIGEKTNIQDFVMIHIGIKTGVYIGKNCSITHHCTLHGCTIGDNCLIGINSTIMDGCVIGNNCIVAGHSFLREGTVIPDNSIVMGSPGKIVRTRDCGEENRLNAIFYHENALAYRKGDHRRWSNREVQALLDR